MAFLDNVDTKISQLGQNAIKKTKDMSESVRIAGLVKEEENKQIELYKKMGEYLYENEADKADGQLKVWCTEVLASKALVKQYEEQIKILKGSVNCPNCGAVVPSTSKFCNMCGSKIEESGVEMPQNNEKNRCPNCGKAVGEGNMFCTACGTKISENVLEKEKLHVSICSECGCEINPQQRFCVNCGTKLIK